MYGHKMLWLFEIPVTSWITKLILLKRLFKHHMHKMSLMEQEQ